MGNIYPTLNYTQIYFIMHNLAIKLRVQVFMCDIIYPAGGSILKLPQHKQQMSQRICQLQTPEVTNQNSDCT